MTARPPTDTPRTALPETGRIHLEGVRKQALECGRNRLLVTGAIVALVFSLIGGRLVHLAVVESAGEPRLARGAAIMPAMASRADIVDRNGVVLATSLPTASLYANPRDVLDAEDAADRLIEVLPELARADALARLRADAGFVWLRRNLTPKQQYAVNRLGIPGLYFHRAERRVYPLGSQASHVLGYTDIDGRGIAGTERYFDWALQHQEGPLQLSIDIRVQSVLRDELGLAMAEFNAIGAAGVILDIATGEVVAMVSLPDFDPNDPGSATGIAGFNRVTKGVYEMGSILKLFTAAMALDSEKVTLSGGYDASRPIHIARFTITDYHGKNRWLSVPEILVYSSNIGAAKMALDVGTKAQQAYLKSFGLLNAADFELPEIGAPLVPTPWREINTMTISYGHGIAVSPLQLTEGVATIVNGGIRRPATLIKHQGAGAVAGTRVISETTSQQMRGLMRLVVKRGTGKNAEAAGYRVGGKTGTAEKPVSGRYGSAQISSFVGAFPMDAPRYVVLALLDEPKGTKKTHGYATGGWVAAPMVSSLVTRLAPLVGIAPAAEAEVPGLGEAVFVPASGGRAALREKSIAAN